MAVTVSFYAIYFLCQDALDVGGYLTDQITKMMDKHPINGDVRYVMTVTVSVTFFVKMSGVLSQISDHKDDGQAPHHWRCQVWHGSHAVSYFCG